MSKSTSISIRSLAGDSYLLLADPRFQEWLILDPSNNAIVEKFSTGIELDENGWQELPLTMALLNSMGYYYV